MIATTDNASYGNMTLYLYDKMFSKYDHLGDGKPLDRDFTVENNAHT